MPYTAQSQFKTDITGYGRKMGRDAGLNEDGRMESVVTLQGERQIHGSVSARTKVAANTESSGGAGLAGDYCPTKGRTDGVIGNERADAKHDD